MKKIKHSFTLLEVTLAIFLTGILLSVLWNLYHRWYQSYLETQQVQQQTNESLLFHHRLHRAFSLFSSPASHGNGPKFFYTPKGKINAYPSLYFSYANEADPEPGFNLCVSSLLYLNSSKELCLLTWGKQDQTRHEILLDNVKSFELHFFDPEEMDWREDWPETFEQEPIWVRVHIERTSHPEIFTFRISRSEEPILYLERK